MIHFSLVACFVFILQYSCGKGIKTWLCCALSWADLITKNCVNNYQLPGKLWLSPSRLLTFPKLKIETFSTSDASGPMTSSMFFLGYLVIFYAFSFPLYLVTSTPGGGGKETQFNLYYILKDSFNFSCYSSQGDLHLMKFLEVDL